MAPSTERSMNSRSQIECFGLTIDGYSEERIIHEIETKTDQKPYWIITANPEILLYAKRHPSYAKTIASADVRMVDSICLKVLGWLQGKTLIRMAGVDLAEKLINWAHETGQTVGFIGGKTSHVAVKAFMNMAKKYPGLQGTAEAGGTVTAGGEGDDANEEARHRLTLQAPDVLFVAFGHPKQERWIEQYVREFPTCRVIVGVGGTFDYWAGTAQRAPKWMRDIGLEWLYRLLKEPKRWKRIFNAVIVFPFLALYDLIAKT